MKSNWNKIHLVTIIFLIVGIISTLLASIIAEDVWKFFSLLFTIVLASLLVGVFFGFLFGIPKLNKQYNPSTDYAKKHKYTPNTNLEDISDWLTKIIVGVSLTQASKISEYLESIAQTILAHNKCRFVCDYSQAIIIALIILFLIAGFIIGYFYTRVYLPDLFSIMEENEQQDAVIKIIEEGYESPTNSSSNEDTPRTDTLNSKLSSLSVEEQNVLNLIFSAGNKYLVQETLTKYQSAAIKVLLIKRIIDIVSGGTSGYSGSSGLSGTSGYSGTAGYSTYSGLTLRIIDNEILKDLKSK